MLNWVNKPYHELEKITMESLAYQMAVTGVVVVAGAVALGLIAYFIITKFLK